MWWFRSLALLGAAAVVAGCGFRPLYGTTDARDAPEQLAAVHIEPIADRTGQILRNHLLDLLNPRGRPTEHRYVLFVKLGEEIQGLAVAKSELATRANLRLSASFTLTQVDGGRFILTGNSVIVSSFNILGAESLATLVAEKDARARALGQIARDITTRLAAFFTGRRAPQGRAAK